MSQTKQTKVYTKVIDHDADISKLAKKVIKSCKYIPQQWISQVEDALEEIQRRQNNNDDVETESISDPTEEIKTKLDSVLELFYGDINDKISASLEVLSLCKEVDNVVIIAQHHQMISAFTRILSDQTLYSIDLTFNISKVFLGLSSFEDLHPVLLKYHVGSIIMAVAEQEARRARKNNDERVDGLPFNSRTRNHRHHCVLYVCLSILVRLSDDMAVLRKMMKKGLMNVITQCMLDELPPNLFGSTLFLLRRASAFGEVAELCADENCLVVERLVSSLPTVNETFATDVLSILYNLSFDTGCRCRMLSSGLSKFLPPLLKSKSSITRVTATATLYQLSIDRSHRHVLLNTELANVLLQSVSPKKSSADPHLSALLVNVSNCSFPICDILEPIKQASN